jgi:hypothetical protein
MHAVFAAKLDERRAGIVLLENKDDLRLGESRVPHAGVLSASRPENPRYQLARITGRRQNDAKRAM